MATSLDLNSTSTKRHAESERILAPLENAFPLGQRLKALREMIAEIEANPPPSDDRAGRSVSASAVGDECGRRVQLGVWPTFHANARPPKKAPLQKKDLIVFARGHATEAWMAEMLRGAGYKLSTHAPAREGEEPRQHGFIAAQGRIKGFADGLFLDEARTLWEHKTLGKASWRKAWNHGLTAAHPKYDAQAQLLMAYMEADASLFTLLNADTGELYAELVSIDARRAQAASDRAVHLLQATLAGDLLPRIANDGASFPCAWCRFKEECWG